MKEDNAVRRFEEEQRRLRMLQNAQRPLMLAPEIERVAPNVPGYGGGKWAMYSVGCCWWTTVPSDLGRHPGNGLPCCPHCYSMLLQAPLAEFLAAARKEPGHYGPGGLRTLALAWSGNATTCYRSWDRYDRR